MNQTTQILKTVRLARVWTVVLLILGSIAIQAADTKSDVLIIAPGGSMVNYLKPMLPGFTAETGITVKLLREEGLVGDAIILAISEKKAHVGFLGNSFEQVIENAKHKKIDVPDVAMLPHEVVGEDSLSFITYKGGPKELKDEDIKKLLLGEVKNWKEISSDLDAPVQLIIQANTTVTIDRLSKEFLGGKDFYRKGMITNLESYAVMVDKIGKTPGAYGYVPGGIDISQVNAPKHKAITRPITAVTLGKPNESAAKLIAYFKKHKSGASTDAKPKKK